MSDDEDISEDVESLRDFCGVRTRDAFSREQFLDTLGRTLNEWADREENGYSKLIADVLPGIVRLSKRCPFSDVREKCSQILNDLKTKGLKIPRALHKGPSSFIPSRETVAIDTTDERTQNSLVEAFLSSGRMSNLLLLMASHPQYLDCFIKTEFFMMQGAGPLAQDWRHYIAIMASSRHNCRYLVKLYEVEFLRHSGNEEWLRGLDRVPKKLRALSEINTLLAHQPWLITTNHIEKVLKGENNWSLSELVQAIVILAHFHSLACLVHGCGIVSEIDLDGGHTIKPTSLTDTNSTSFEATDNNCASQKESDGSSCMTELIGKMKEVEAERDHAMADVTQEILYQHYEQVESGELATCSDKTYTTPELEPGFARYLEDPSFRYSDFASRKEEEISTFRVQDYSWEEHGFSLVNRLYPDVGQLLDDEFSTAINLTYYTLGREANVDTSHFRLATWNYIHLVFGIYHDDYMYTEVNKLLERSYKNYIKTTACWPERVTQNDYLEFMPELTHSEKVHINLILVEARIQAELLYALRAIMQYMT